MIPHGREDCPLVVNQLCAFSRLPIHLASPVCGRFWPSVGLIGFRHALWRPVNHSELVEIMPPGIGGGIGGDVDILVAVSVRSPSPSSFLLLLVRVDSHIITHDADGPNREIQKGRLCHVVSRNPVGVNGGVK